MFPAYIIDEVIDEIVAEARDELARIGIFFGEVEELDTYGVQYCTIVFRDVAVNLENRELRKELSMASESWERFFKALALERIVSGSNPDVHDYVDVEEISWNRNRGPFVRLNVSLEVEGLLRKYGLADLNVREMEECLEGILDYEARRILRRLNEALREAMAEARHARGEVVPLRSLSTSSSRVKFKSPRIS